MNRAKIFIAFTILLALAFQVSAQSIQFPNEIKGYEFFGNGKLKDLQMTVSSKTDVKKIFGENCEKDCDYDADWLIGFEYYEDYWVKAVRTDQDEKPTYFDSKFLGKLKSIEIRPKKQLSFIDISFPDIFQKTIMTTFIDERLGKDRKKINDVFLDSDGLMYVIYRQIKYGDINDKKVESHNKGDLVLISYETSKELYETLFVFQK